MTKRQTRARSTALSVVLMITAMSAPNAFAEPPVEKYGRLYADGNKIVGEKSGGEAVQLKGASLQWSVAGWGSDRFFREETVNALVDGWEAAVIRAPLGIDFNKREDHHVENGYKTKPEENWNRVKTAVDAAVARGVYAIVDWHSHTAHDPDETQLAMDFFTNPGLAGKYGGNPAVIFEIYNEPEDDVTWAQVKAYAEAVIAAIRRKGFDNLILVGSPQWDLSVDIAAASPPADSLDNFALAFHFYADGHRMDAARWFSPAKTHKKAIEDALAAGAPVFVTEWGTNDATAENPPNFAEADKWHTFLDANKISSCAWGVTASDYNVLDYWTDEGSPLSTIRDPAALPNWTNPRWMTPHGRYIYRLLTGKDTTYSVDGGHEFPQYDGPRNPIPLTAALTEASKNDASTVSRVIEEGGMRVKFELNSMAGGYEWDPYALVYYDIGLSECGWGIGYKYKGSGNHTIRIHQSDVDDDTSYAYHANKASLIDVEGWTEIRAPWSYFEQPSWVEPAQKHPVDIAKITGISWYTEDKAGVAGEYWIKDVECLGYGEPQSSVRPNRKPPPVNAAQFMKVSGRTLHLRLPQSGKVDIYDLKGGKIRSIKLNQGVHAVKMGGLPKGMYMVRAQSGAWNRSVKMLIK